MFKLSANSKIYKVKKKKKHLIILLIKILKNHGEKWPSWGTPEMTKIVDE